VSKDERWGITLENWPIITLKWGYKGKIAVFCLHRWERKFFGIMPVYPFLKIHNINLAINEPLCYGLLQFVDLAIFGCYDTCR